MPNAWVEFVRQYAKENNLSYGCAISEASPAYRKIKQEKNSTQKDSDRLRLTNRKMEVKIWSDGNFENGNEQNSSRSIR